MKNRTISQNTKPSRPGNLKASSKRKSSTSPRSNSETPSHFPNDNGGGNFPVSLKGLQNKNSNCWLNSLLQCFSVTNVVEISTDEYQKNLNSLFFLKFLSFVNLLNKNKDDGMSVYPKELIAELHKKGFYKGHQHDVHEAFSKILEDCSFNLREAQIPPFLSFWGSIKYKKNLLDM